jgi:nucleotide-binding universal stress UspA family protein
MQDSAQMRHIVVGVDGSLVARSAVLWAAREARLRQCDLIITHIDPPQTDAVGLDRGRPTHNALLDDLAAMARREPSISISTRLLQGSISDELIGATETAVLLVLGIDRGKERASHGALGPLEDRVAVHAHCPVVVVSRLLNSSAKPPKEVVVGWIDAVSAWWAFNAAVAAAGVRRAPLTVLRVVPVNRQDDEPFAGDRPLLEAISDEQQPVCPPDLSIRISHKITDHTADALVRAADEADLLVIGCHHSDDQWTVRTGPVAAAVVRGASCPVMLVSQPVHWESNKLHESPRTARD